MLVVYSVLSTQLLSTNAPALGCFWTYGTDIRGRMIEVNERSPKSYMEYLTGRHHAEFAEWQRKAKELDGKAKIADYRSQNDSAVALAHLGDYSQAIEILNRIEAEHPGEYVTAANLGTVYELQENLPLALKWIKECVSRNEDSHYGTEWLHVRILEAKLQLSEDPAWLTKNSILGIEFGNEIEPSPSLSEVKDSSGAIRSLDDIQRAIEHQLSERIELAPLPDAIVADLLADLGCLVTRSRSLEFAIPVFELALKYGPTHPETVQRRLMHYRNVVALNPISGWHRYDVVNTTIVCVFASLAVFVGWKYYRRRSPQRVG
jgi:tetratricopeptide (TPR) repeat protein